MNFKTLLQAVLLAVSGGFLSDLKNTGLDVDSTAMWGNLFVALSGLGLTFGLTKDKFVQLVTLGWAQAKKWNESDLPNGCTGSMNWIVAGLKRGVDPSSLKVYYDAQWPIIVAECAVPKKEVANAA